MIKLWLARRSSIAIREQLSAQFILGIVSRKLAPGERLPSVRELGRRLHLHSNTISATYRDLAKRGWVSNRRGSGVFVRKAPILDQNNSLDAFVATCIEDGLARGFPLDALRVAFGNISHASRQAELLVVDPDPELARVLAVEIGGAIGTHVPYSGYDGVSEKLRANTCVLSIEAHLPRTAKLLPGSIIRPIHLKSMQEMLIGQQRPPAAVLIAVASRSASILRWGFHPNCRFGLLGRCSTVAGCGSGALAGRTRSVRHRGCRQGDRC